MISVPYTIKELYHQDHAYKNIRIHFPNGERSDICNNLIVKDSVSFTESLCSQDTLKFGLCEASVFECETVGVGDIKGATIEVSCEIECPAGITGAEWKSDLQKYVHSIPYGTFIVKESKRQADVHHRKIVAYSKMAFYGFNINEHQRYKFDYAVTNNVPFTQALPYFINEAFQSEVYDVTYSEEATNYTAYLTLGSAQQRHKEYFYYKIFRISEQRSHNLIHVAIDEPTVGKETCILYDYWEYAAATSHKMPHGYGYYVYQEGLAHGFEYLYPEMSMKSSEAQSFFSNKEYYVSVLYRWEYYDSQGVLKKRTDYFNPDNISIQMGTRTILDEESFSWERAQNKNSKYQVPSVDDINLRELFEAFLELEGYIGKFDRSDKFSLIDIRRQFYLNPDTDIYPGSDLYPQGVIGGRLLPGDYQSCWYDNEYRKLFGLITVQYKDENDEDCIRNVYINGFNENSDSDSYYVYDLSNNYLVKSKNWNYSLELSTFIAIVVARLVSLTYMPVEFVGRGLPYVETGDTFEILTRSNDSITTIVLNRTITGEQTLTDSYKSV